MRTASVIYHPGMPYRAVEPENGKFFSLKELQAVVGGKIERLSLKNGMAMVVNEEGKLKGLPYNDLATAIAYNSGCGDMIVGTVLVCPNKYIR